MLNPCIIQKFFIDGPIGKLETILAEPGPPPSGIAIIAHPHPLYGGSMNNKIVTTLFNTLIELGFITVKFNFRGVGSSEGVYDNGIGEIEDIVTVTHAIRNQFNNLVVNIPLLLAGFSFGGTIQLRAADQLKPQQLILVAPSVAHLNTPPVPELVKRTLVIHGNLDDVIPLEKVLKWAEPQTLPVVVIPGAGHFFHGKLPSLKQVILNAF